MHTRQALNLLLRTNRDYQMGGTQGFIVEIGGIMGLTIPISERGENENLSGT